MDHCSLNIENKYNEEETFIPSNIFKEKFQRSAREGNLREVKTFMETLFSNKFVADDNNLAIILASKNNHFEVVEFLLQFQPVKDKAHLSDNLLLRCACYNGNQYIVRLLLKLPNVVALADTLNNDALLGACINRHRTIVELLTRIPSVMANINHKIILAVIKNEQDDILNNINDERSNSIIKMICS